ncbi:MAG: CAP domain-containing protein [Thermoanaerobaculia bacterium]
MNAGRRLRVLPFLCVGLVGLGVVACGSGGGSSPTEPGGVSALEVEQRSFELLNDARAGAGVTPPFNLDSALTQVARQHSQSMRDNGYFGHRDPEGRNLVQRLAEAGISFSAAAENLARVSGAPDPAGWAHDQLLQSQEHRDNILNGDFRLVGVGVAQAGDTYWITQVFLKP